jgi:chemotaxis signal transduction protein
MKWSSGRGPGSRTPGDAARAESSLPGGSDTELEWFGDSVCVFWLGRTCYGVPTSRVAEVVLAEFVLAEFVLAETHVLGTVPRPGLLGRCDVHGARVELVDLAQVLELPRAATLVEERPDGKVLALVLRAGAALVAAPISRLEVVVPAGQSLLHAAGRGPGERPVLAGSLVIPERPQLRVALLQHEELVSRLLGPKCHAIKERP